MHESDKACPRLKPTQEQPLTAWKCTPEGVLHPRTIFTLQANRRSFDCVRRLRLLTSLRMTIHEKRLGRLASLGS